MVSCCSVNPIVRPDFVISLGTNGEVVIKWKVQLTQEEQETLKRKLNMYVPTKERWLIMGNIAKTHYNTLEKLLLEDKGEIDRLILAASLT